MDVALKTPVAGGAAGSGLWGATDSTALERLEGAVLGNIRINPLFQDIYQN